MKDMLTVVYMKLVTKNTNKIGVKERWKAWQDR